MIKRINYVEAVISGTRPLVLLYRDSDTAKYYDVTEASLARLARVIDGLRQREGWIVRPFLAGWIGWSARPAGRIAR